MDRAVKSQKESVKSKKTLKNKPITEKKDKRDVKGKRQLSFEEMLALGDEVAPVKKKRAKTGSSRSADLLPNYVPLPPIPLPRQPSQVSGRTQPTEDTDNFDLLKFKHKSCERQRVFAGKKKGSGGEINTLFSLATKALIANINLLGDVGDIPFYVLRNVVARATVPQLLRIEAINPRLAEDSDELWEAHFRRLHPGQETYATETWKGAFMRAEREKENHLKQISNRIRQQDEGLVNSQRTIQLAAPLAPSNVRRRQMANGISTAPRAMPDALELSKARKQIFETGRKDVLKTMPSSVRNMHSMRLPSYSSKPDAPKKGALMAKVVKMMKNKKR